ncbi:MAG: glutamine synthetase [Verrucomicrobiales bacterium]
MSSKKRGTHHRHKYSGLCPAYDIYPSLDSIDLLPPLVSHLNELGYGVFSFDQEGGHGQYDFDFAYSDALTMCDHLAFLQKVSFSARCSTGTG